MQEQSKRIGRKRRKPLSTRSTLALAVLLIFSTLLCIGLTSSSLSAQQGSVVAVSRRERWESDGKVTEPDFAFSLASSQVLKVSPLFEGYYQKHNGKTSLGAPITTAFPTNRGWLQFYSLGALFLPDKQQSELEGAKDVVAGLISTGVTDRSTGVERLSLLPSLLNAGSQVPIGGQGSSLTYVNVRRMMSSSLLTKHAVSSPSLSKNVFVKMGTFLGQEVGHFIPQSLWTYMNRADVSPDSWVKDFGLPETEVISFTAKKDGQLHHMQIQVFERDALLLDQDALDASGQPVVQRVTSGLDYLNTLGGPDIAVKTQQTVWAQGISPLLSLPAKGQEVAHVGENFPLTLLGEAQWQSGMLWYHVQWSAPKTSGNGWITASAVSYNSPSSMLSHASVDVLSSDLGKYLSQNGDRVGVAVYDMTRQRTYTYNGNIPFAMASSMKVPIMLAFFDKLESQGQEPDDDQMQLLTTMIENSDNDSASSLFFDELGGAEAITNYLQKIGVAGLTPDGDSWGYSTITPQTMVTLLTLLQQGKILTPYDRSIALNLMRNVETDQQVGVGDTTPQGASVALKDGWVVGPDSLWVMNSSGIVTRGKEIYIIAVYTQRQNALEDGQSIVRRVCKTIADKLLS